MSEAVFDKEPLPLPADPGLQVEDRVGALLTKIDRRVGSASPHIQKETVFPGKRNAVPKQHGKTEIKARRLLIVGDKRFQNQEEFLNEMDLPGVGQLEKVVGAVSFNFSCMLVRV